MGRNRKYRKTILKKIEEEKKVLLHQMLKSRSVQAFLKGNGGWRKQGVVTGDDHFPPILQWKS